MTDTADLRERIARVIAGPAHKHCFDTGALCVVRPGAYKTADEILSLLPQGSGRAEPGA
jgi:hypothetical protein